MFMCIVLQSQKKQPECSLKVQIVEQYSLLKPFQSPLRFHGKTEVHSLVFKALHHLEMVYFLSNIQLHPKAPTR